MKAVKLAAPPIDVVGLADMIDFAGLAGLIDLFGLGNVVAEARLVSNFGAGLAACD